MAILAKENAGGGDFTPIPEKTYLGRCVHVIELGHIFSQRWGNTTHKAMIGFEIIDDSVRYKNKDGDEVRPILYWEGTVSLNKKSNLRPMMESWFGKSMPPEALSGGFDITKSLNHPAMIGVKHSAPNESGRVYANLGSITKPLDGIVVPPAEHQQFFYEIEMLTGGTWSRVPDWIKKKIEDSVEFAGKMAQAQNRNGQPLAATPTQTPQAQAPVDTRHPLAINPELVNDPTSPYYVKPSDAPF